MSAERSVPCPVCAGSGYQGIRCGCALAACLACRGRGIIIVTMGESQPVGVASCGPDRGKQMAKTLLLVLAILCLSCGGGGGESASLVPVRGGPAADVDAAGVFDAEPRPVDSQPVPAVAIDAGASVPDAVAVDALPICAEAPYMTERCPPYSWCYLALVDGGPVGPCRRYLEGARTYVATCGLCAAVQP